MRKIVFLLIASFALVFTACNKDKIDKVNPADLEVNLNKAELQTRIEMLNFPVVFNNLKASADVTPIPELWAVARILPALRTYTVYHWTNTHNAVVYDRTTATNSAPTVTTIAAPGFPSIQLPLVAAVPASTTYTNQTMSLTGAGLATSGPNTYAIFTSHVRGDVYGGEIFTAIYDNDDDDSFEAEFSVFDNTADYNDLTVELNTTLWMVGDNNARGAIVRKVSVADLAALAADEMQATDFTLTNYNMPILGPSGNSITVPKANGSTTTAEENQLWVVAGGTSYGGLVVMDKNDHTRLFTRMDRTHAKHFDMGEFSHGSGNYGAFLWGDGNFANNTANLRIFNTSSGPFSYKDFTVPADVTFEGKNAIDVSSDGTPEAVNANQSLYMAMGADGVLKVNLTGIYAAAAAPPAVTALALGPNVTKFNGVDTFGGNGLANGLVVHGAYVYVAWGASGLIILDKATMTMVGQYNGIGSCNYVAVDTSGAETIIWAGFGTGGMVMLKFVNNVNP